MKLVSNSFADGSRIPAKFALATHDPHTHARFSDNISPHLAWSFVPNGTRSFAIVCVDPDAPSDGSDVNQEDREVPADLPRANFYHWALADLGSAIREIDEGEFSDGVIEGGKNAPFGPHGTIQGINDYTGWFAGDETMAGVYFGYDGPAPPWNDSIEHRYVFTVYALDVDHVDVSGEFTAGDLLEAIEGHVLAEASLTGIYTQTPRLL